MHPSPSNITEAGRKILADDPGSPGSLGIAISEAVEVAGRHDDTRYSLGSVLNHVLMHQTVIGEEALTQLADADETPDLIVGCTGGGSNFAGLFFPFLREKLAGRLDPTIRAVEPAACPSFTRGRYTYDYGDTAGFTPLLKMHTLGHDFVPEPIHAGGLRYHGMSPAAVAHVVPAPEPTHAIAAAVEEALRCRESGEEKVILTAMCGHGHFDLAAYDRYLSGRMEDFELPRERIDAALTRLPDTEL